MFWFERTCASEHRNNSKYENHETLYLWISCEFLDFCHPHFWYHLMQINLPMIILGQMIVFCNWFHWKFNNFTQKNLNFYTYMFWEIVCIICIHLFANNFIRWKMQTIFVCEQFAKYNCSVLNHILFHQFAKKSCWNEFSTF